MADTPSRATDTLPRILSLDGGGVRGLSSLLILRDIMEDIENMTGAEATPKPCEYFDLIGGTSTGGLIAIMLGLLGMVMSVNLFLLTERA
jgi:patatin-like phospholipase/acyl hydrolase